MAPVPAQARSSPESLFDFLVQTRSPLVVSLVAAMRAISCGLGLAAVGYGFASLLLWSDGWWGANLPWGGALPAFAAAPFLGGSWIVIRTARLQAAAVWLFTALFVFSILAVLPRGAFCASWYLQPLLALLATCCVGVVPGLLLTLLAVCTMMAAPALVAIDSGGSAVGLMPDVWAHSASLAAVTLASALTGALVHKLMLRVLQVNEAQRQRNFEWGRALRHRERLLRHALRVETVGDLAGMVSHQLRNTFQVLMGHVALGQEAPDGELRQRLRAIGETLDGARPLLEQLMGLAHPDEGRIAREDLGALVEDFHRRAAPVISSAIQLIVERSPDALPVMLDQRGFEHALWNLVINAQQAIDGAGRITLRAERRGAFACLSVADTGCGMTKEVRERIFDPYFTTKPPGKGTGLGLAAVARFVRSGNGTIDVHSEPDRGSTFELRFPLATDERILDIA